MEDLLVHYIIVSQIFNFEVIDIEVYRILKFSGFCLHLSPD